jgi:hypothetical protein
VRHGGCEIRDGQWCPCIHRQGDYSPIAERENRDKRADYGTLAAAVCANCGQVVAGYRFPDPGNTPELLDLRCYGLADEV